MIEAWQMVPHDTSDPAADEAEAVLEATFGAADGEAVRNLVILVGGTIQAAATLAVSFEKMIADAWAQ